MENNKEKIQLVKYGNTNCYYIEGEFGSLIIDTDWAGTIEKFYKKMKELDIKKIDYIVISHFHPDHMGIAQNIMNLGTKLLLLDVQIDYIHCSDEILNKDKSKNFESINLDSATIITCDESRNFLKKLGINGEIIHTPGHSEDSISVILDSGSAFVGDLYEFKSASCFGDEKINASWNKILQHKIKNIYYGHSNMQNF